MLNTTKKFKWDGVDIVLKSGRRTEFTVIDSLIGLTIICSFSLFYIQTIHQMNQNIESQEQVMVDEREKYESEILNQ